MYSKSKPIATNVLALLIMLLASSCRSSMPWQKEPIGEEVNLAFTLENNLIFLSTTRVDGHNGRFFFASATPQSVLDPRFAATVTPDAGAHTLQIGERDSLRFSPILFDLGGVADALVGADVWGGHAVSIDYRSGLITYQKEGIHPELMTLYRFTAAPTVTITVDGRSIPAIVDTALPDTLVLPRATRGRTTAHVTIAGTDFGNVDIRLGDVTQPRIGNRLLSKFLISIDYGKQEVGLWRDPRTPI